MAKYPSEEQERFIIRMPDGMRDRLKARAEENGRSMNAEVVLILAERIRDDLAAERAMLEDPGAIDEFSEELTISEAVGQQAGSPANVVFIARLMARVAATQKDVAAMHKDIDRKIKRLVELQEKSSAETQDKEGEG